ncbi:carbohydrate ABC transporter permease [Paenibacillus sp. KQZ6P-2]|uniref:Carbohydrate ABC transporter permease n=1 Tax=Paenibacillus mangrovi TaxID=2931978 RepID=A0A9X1WNJ9_9BACL|nr:carbohydrate ABC transporter permease [Paenibacillus mangrovi]MCJ8010858.1 carbohydrate ABC transporter permease [Paenibacillus mangrovi]
MSDIVMRIKRHIQVYQPPMKKFLFGMQISDGMVYKAATYLVLTIFGFIFLYPLLYMLSTSLMSNLDLVDNTVEWLPTSLYTFNYEATWKALKMPGSYVTTILLAGASTLSVILSSALVGYGLARFHFPGKKLVFALLLFTFIVPKALFFIPKFQIFMQLGLKGNLGALVVPALTGQGEQAALFILIFYQFFRMIPKVLEEAACIDGAGAIRTFWNIAIPMVGPAFIIVGVYGFSIYWNETFLTSFYLDGKIQTVPMLLGNLQESFGGVVAASKKEVGNNPNWSFSEAKAFAGTILSIAPLAILYLIVQRWFVQSIDKTGITGE